MEMFDVIVIGAGTSGMMAAISAAKNGAKTLLLEKNKRVGKKMLLTGGGRCNVTNNCDVEELIQHIPGNGKFLYSTFAQFNNHDLIQFFTENHVPLKEEDHGRMFPITNQSKTIVEALVAQLNQYHVKLLTGVDIQQLKKNQDGLFILKSEAKETFSSFCVIVATGGKSYPQTGSTGRGYRLARNLGHSIMPLYPTEAPLLSKEEYILDKRLQGLSLRDVQLTVLTKEGKPIVSHLMDLLFTHFGLSGPTALRCSTFVIQELKEATTATVSLDAMPHQNKIEIDASICKIIAEEPKKSCKNALKKLLPERYMTFLLQQSNIDENQPVIKLDETARSSLIASIKAFPILISGTWPLERAFVTGGGITLKEVQPKSMESKVCEGLFFCGEILDINGYTGGYNVTAALCTGFVAGKHAAEIASWSS